MFTEAARTPTTKLPASEPKVDIAWLLGRLHRAPVELSRRRFHTFLFAQRVFTGGITDPRQVFVLNRFGAYPALMLTLESAGLTNAEALAAAATRADAIERIGDDRVRRLALMQFQSLVGVIERMRQREASRRPSRRSSWSV